MNIEKLLPGWFEGCLSDKEKKIVIAWKNNNPENLLVFEDSQKTWEAIKQLLDISVMLTPISVILTPLTENGSKNR